MDVITTFSSRHLFGFGGNGWSFLKQEILLVVGLRMGDAVHCVSFSSSLFVGGMSLSLSKHFLDDLSGLIRSPVFCVSHFFL